MDLNGIPIEDQWNTIINSAKNIEDLNYESVWVYDHFHTVPKPTQDPTYECWTLMSHYHKQLLKFVLVKCVHVTHIEIHPI